MQERPEVDYILFRKSDNVLSRFFPRPRARAFEEVGDVTNDLLVHSETLFFGSNENDQVVVVIESMLLRQYFGSTNRNMA